MISWLLGPWSKPKYPPPHLDDTFLGCVRVEAKPWGILRVLHESPMAAMYQLKIDEGGYSSIHFHRFKRQVFSVVFGKILMIEFDNACTTETRRQLLLAGDTWATPVRTRHQFRALTAAVVIEVYPPVDLDVPVLADDIVRLSIGGCG